MPRLAAAEALIDTLARADGERAGLLVMERTEADKVCATPFERNVVADHLFYLGGGENTVYGLARNQGKL